MGELEANRDAHEHAKPGLLGHERAHRSSALLLVLLTRDAAYLGVVCLAEPTAFGKRFREYALKRRGSMDDDVLGMGKTPGLNQLRERCVHLGCSVGTIRQGRLIIGLD